MRGLWELRSYMRPYRGMFVAVLVLMGITAALGAGALYKTEGLFEAIVSDEIEDPLGHAINAALLVLVLLLTAAVCEGLSVYGSEWIGQRFLLDLRKALFKNLEWLSLRFFEGRQAGEMVSRINSDTLILQQVLGMQLGPAILAPLSATACIVFMVRISWRLTLLMLIIGPLVALLTNVLGRRLRRYVLLFQQRLADLAVVVAESFSLMRVVKIFGMEKRAAQRFDSTAKGVMRAELRAARMRAVNIPMVGAFVGVAICAGLLLGAREVLLGYITSSQALTFVVLMQRAGGQIGKLSRMGLQLHRADAAAQRTIELLELEPEIEDDPDAQELTELKGEVTFDNVSFTYAAGVEVLSEINLTIRPGEVVALVGPSGSGKTSLANLIPRLYDVSEGQVLIDGIDVRKITQASLRAHMGIVPQETVLFSGTVWENIAFGKDDATDDEIVAAALAADADEFIRALPEGYETQVGERGGKLSGGQRQRIAIARAILRDPRILILDEATSSLDRASEAVVHRALDGLMSGRTALIIAHRLSTVRNAGRILVLNEGRIVEEGTHAELMQAGGLYRQLYESQDIEMEEASEDEAGEPTPSVAP